MNVADLIEVLDVELDDDGSYIGLVRDDPYRPVVEGSQMLAQSIVAAGRRQPDRRPVSSNMLFARVANTSSPVAIVLDEVANGRTFSAYTTRAVQGGKVCAVGNVMTDVKAPDVMRHHAAMPDVPGPEDVPEVNFGLDGRDIRIIDNAWVLDSNAPVGPPVLDAWVRYTGLPDDPVLHAGVVAFITGNFSIGTAMRPHAGIGQDQAHRTLSTGVNAIYLSFHAEPRADEWLLYRHESTFAGDGMTHSECRVFTHEGALVASFSVESMVRGFADPSKASDPSRAM